MVNKHGRNRKRRAGRIGRTKLKQQGGYKRWNPKLKIVDPTVKKLWNINKSPQQNLASMGLTLKPNNVNNVKIATSTTTSTNKPNMIELFDVPESDVLSSCTKKTNNNNNNNNNDNRIPLNQQEQEFVLKAITKYGITSFSSSSSSSSSYYETIIFRDIKDVNKLQYTQSKIQKLISRFLLLQKEQLLIPINKIPKEILEHKMKFIHQQEER